jgi:hypothetical protein
MGPVEKRNFVDLGPIETLRSPQGFGPLGNVADAVRFPHRSAVNLVSDTRVERGCPAYRSVCRSAIVNAGVLYQG